MSESRFKDTSPMPFGKHKGTPLKNVPGDYLLWLYEQMKIDDDKIALFLYVMENFDSLESEAEDARFQCEREGDEW